MGSRLNWYRAKKARGVIVLAHGAGAGQKHPWIVQRATAWSLAGFDVATFDFPYMAAGKRAPDKPAVLEATWRQAVDDAGGEVIAAGKSMGGRIATMVSSAGCTGIKALVTLGYPLHPPGQPDKLRIAHLPAITVPWLAVQGERDAFGPPAELRPYLPKSAQLMAVPGDHALSKLDDALILTWLNDL